ncbi:bifunctional 4-hydroxy-2-oxoglutarate aldolase/2-dehydro-3-deoxy-phosphogluconate aldolase [Paenibacillus hemerocallicola]|uniref:Bifunctional 4-hydroxy-2-oxoglutarate aldolase/2-dehydro-3-deoxy-phosphogluconate aldolase n=1 Tax=Paenibacillus hemerocallicola TaxID=1172614 RepID=A0A5C4TGS3_9BACL|nr:bifunctional 4-hydroxy-2-oxoglutarate aldolase/2-dehydro-3-deoxy-phosphogluconate aldolase [Paenibacillus hemerocallicola]TNJ67787.1 bifunctional 4-hydroxy-2-oxoglutarate aldolase/2-dehydro-3-deoxy-phosphogluconate aldolase [Paenibacillus hemerocallicola]
MRPLQKGTIISIVRGVDPHEIVPIAEALLEEGIEWLEVSLSEEKQGLDNIKLLSETYGDRLQLGVGTVIHKEQADRAIAAGARYVITPGWERELVRYVKSLDMQIFPGVYTPGDIMQAVQEQLQVVKLFPASTLGADFVKQVQGPFPSLHIMGVGGIALSNINSFYEAGCSSFAIGSDLVPRGATRQQLSTIRERAKQYKNILHEKG